MGRPRVKPKIKKTTLKKNVECKLKECKVRFDQKVPWHDFCSSDCRIKYNSIVEEEVRKPQRKKERKLCHCGCGRPRGKGLHLLSEYCYRNADNWEDDLYSVHI